MKTAFFEAYADAALEFDNYCDRWLGERTSSGNFPNREEKIEIILNATWRMRNVLFEKGFTEDDCRRLKKPLPSQMGVSKLESEVWEEPRLTEKEAWDLVRRAIAPPPEPPKVEEEIIPAPKEFDSDPTLIRERGLQWLMSESGYGRSEIVGPEDLAARKKMKLMIDAIATILVRSKDKAFIVLHELGPMSKEDMLEYDKLAWTDALDLEVTDRQIMEVLNAEGEPIHGWEIEAAMWELVNFYAKVNRVKILASGKDWTDIEGVKEPVRFLANLRVDYQGRLSFRRLRDERRGIEHRYHLWLGGLGMAFLSNLIQNRFLLEALGTVRRLPPTASEVWRAIEPFRGKWQYRRLEFFERVLGLEGRDAGATKKHLQTIRRALASLNEEGLVELWGSTGRGRETIFRFWIEKRPALTPAQ